MWYIYFLLEILVIFLFFLVLWKKLSRENFFLLFISLTISLLTTEFIFRYLDIGNPTKIKYSEKHTTNKKYEYHKNSQLVYEYPDNPRAYFDNNKVIGHINNLGFRGRETTKKKPDNIYRIAFLGDSFTIGWGVKDNDTFPRQVELNLQKQIKNIEVLNFGISGSSTERQAELLSKYVVEFSPDMLALVFFLNDADRRGTMFFMESSKIFSNLRKISYFVNAFIGSFESYFMHKAMVSHYINGYKKDSPGWIKAKETILKIKAIADKKGMDFVLVLYPVLYKLNSQYPFTGIHKTIFNFAQNNKIMMVDLFNALQGKNARKLWVSRVDQHPNEIAHAITAKYMSAILLKNYSFTPDLNKK